MKKHSLALILVKVFIFTLFISSIVKAVIGEATVVKMDTRSPLLLQQISQTNNHKLEFENKNLKIKIKKDDLLYEKNLNMSKIVNNKIAYLTFDDGPSKNTLETLKILKYYKIKATFFVNYHPDLKDSYKQIFDDGHALSNHTYSHDYKNIYSSTDNFKKDVKKLDSYITEITGKEANHILRYPGGSNNSISVHYGGLLIMNSIIKEMDLEGYTYFDWNVDSTDALKHRQSKDIIVHEVLTQSSKHKHPIILLHDLDAKTTTVQALPEIIEGLKNQGFIFDVLSNNIYSPQFTKLN